MTRPDCVSIQIRTADLHSPVARRAAFTEAQAVAATLGLDIVGDYLSGPRIDGDLNSSQVRLAWDAVDNATMPDAGTFVGPHPDGTCVGCGERLIRVVADDDRHLWCDRSPVNPDYLTADARALLILGASGVTDSLVSGTSEDEAALWLGRLWGRAQGFAVVEVDGQPVTYRWPTDWSALLADCLAWGAVSDVRVYRKLRMQPLPDGAAESRVRWLGRDAPTLAWAGWDE